MKGVPIPDSRRGWVTVLLLAVLAFAAYYLAIFPSLMQFYDYDLYVGQSVARSNPVSLCSDEARQTLDRLTIRVGSPWHIAPFVRRWISVTIRNNGNLPVEDVEWWIDIYTQSETEVPNGPILPFLFNESNTLQTSVHFTQIAPHATVTGRAPIFVVSSAERSMQGLMWVRVQDCVARAEVMGDIVPLQINGIMSLAHSLVENLLLPPWSNGLLVTVILIVSYIAEKDAEANGDKQSLRPVLWIALRYLIAVWVLALALVCIPWLLWPLKRLILLPPFLLLLLLVTPARDKMRRWLHKEEEQKKSFVRYILVAVFFVVALIWYSIFGKLLGAKGLSSLLTITWFLLTGWILLGKVGDKTLFGNDFKTVVADGRPIGGENDV